MLCYILKKATSVAVRKATSIAQYLELATGGALISVFTNTDLVVDTANVLTLTIMNKRIINNNKIYYALKNISEDFLRYC